MRFYTYGILYYVINNYDEEDGINNEILEYVNNFVDINK